MTAAALGLVLLASFFHASWNFLAKRAGSGALFVWLFAVGSAFLYAPLAVAAALWQRPRLGPLEGLFMVGSGVLHLAYFVLLQHAYQRADLSVVYPVARSTGPALATLAAIVAFGERPPPLALLGAGLIVAGALAIATGSRRPGTAPGPSRRIHPGVVHGVVVGLTIAAYTLWDKHAVSALAIPPLLQEWTANLVRAMLLTPFALCRWEGVRREWQAHRKEVLGASALSPAAYILVLTALSFTPVSYVAPAREISILIGTFLGTRLLAEGDMGKRLVAAGVMVAGLVALAVAA